MWQQGAPFYNLTHIGSFQSVREDHLHWISTAAVLHTTWTPLQWFIYQCCPIAWPSFQYGSFQSVRTPALLHTAWTPLQWFINVAPAPYTYSLPKLSICANLSCESIHICHSNTHGLKLWRCFQLFSVQAKKCEYGLKNRLERKFLAAGASSFLSFLLQNL